MHKALLFLLFLFLSVAGSAQRDYFMAAALIDQNNQSEAVKILDDLIDSNVYVARPRMHMMTLNLAGAVKHYLGDSAGSKLAFRAALTYYDTLSLTDQQDNFVMLEKYIACRKLADWKYADRNYPAALLLLNQAGPPGPYYSAQSSVLLMESDSYFSFKAKTFQELAQPDSAFQCLIHLQENDEMYKLGLLFRNPANEIQQVSGLFFGVRNMVTMERGSDYLYAVTYKQMPEHSYQTIWIVNYGTGGREILGRSSNEPSDSSLFPAMANNIVLSQNEKFLAVECYGEGNSWIEILDFPFMLKQKKCSYLNSVTPYPGNVWIKGWENNLLVISADIDLSRLNRKNHLSAQDLFGTIGEKRDFLFDPVEKKYSRK